MITCTTHNSHGRLGNQIMRMMAIIKFAKTYNTGYTLLWRYADYFEDIIIGFIKPKFRLDEKHFHYTPEYYDKYSSKFRTMTVDLYGYFQSPMYWDKIQIKQHYKSLVKSKYKYLFEKETIAISVRRGDFVGNPNYYQLENSYYEGSILEHFRDYEKYQIIFFSDDIKYCIEQFGYLRNACFADTVDIEQLTLMTLCDNHIISNSTFSYVGAYLSESKKVIRPLRNFDGHLARVNSEKDYWVKDWIIHE